MPKTDPRDVLERCLARVQAHDEAVHAFTFVDQMSARAAAAASADRWRTGSPASAIDGMPVAVKANIAVAGWPWSAGIRAYQDRVADTDAASVARLRTAGAVIIGLTNMDEGALGAVTDNGWSGRTHNPHFRGFTAGGSSGGSAAAVAAGFCVAALGTDTIGSVRIPAAYCGVVGHKPARKSIPTTGVVPLSSTLDTVGLIAATAGTCAQLLHLFRPTRPGGSDVLSGRTIAVPAWRETAVVDADMAQAFERTVRAASVAGARIVMLSPGALPFAAARRALLVVAEVEAARVHRQALDARPDGFSAGFAALLAWGSGPGITRYEAALTTIAETADRTGAVLADADALLCPTVPGPAFRFEEGAPADQAVFSGPASCLGCPATAFPIGRSREGLPLSAQVIADNDALCLAIAQALSVA